MKNLVESAKRLRSSKTVKKDAVTSEMLIEVCDRFSGATDLLLLTDLSMILVGFAGFLRFDELVELTCKDVKFHDGYCYDIKPVRKEEGKSYWKIPLCDEDATREK